MSPFAKTLSESGVLTPDHAIRTKNRTVFLDLLPEKDENLKEVIVKKVKDFTGEYGQYFQEQARKRGFSGEIHDPYPRLFLVAGLFKVEPGRKGYDKSSVLAVRRTRLHSGKQTLTLVTDEEPNFAGIDPFNKLIDRNSDDNVKETAKAESLASLSRP